MTVLFLLIVTVLAGELAVIAFALLAIAMTVTNRERHPTSGGGEQLPKPPAAAVKPAPPPPTRVELAPAKANSQITKFSNSPPALPPPPPELKRKPTGLFRPSGGLDASGNPATVIRPIFEDEMPREQLLDQLCGVELYLARVRRLMAVATDQPLREFKN